MTGVTLSVVIDRWDDEMKPTAVAEMPPRVFAQEVIAETEWHDLCDRVLGDDADPLVVTGTAAWISNDIVKLRRTENTLLAWLVARMRRVSMCFADGHDNEGIHYFNDCWADEDESPHQWETWWALDADPGEFIAFAQSIARLP